MVHDVGAAGAIGSVDGKKVLGGGEPGGVGDDVQAKAVLPGLGEVEPEFALGGLHDGELGERTAALQLAEGLAVAERGEVVKDVYAEGGLLEREVAHVADEQNEFLLVVGAAVGLGGGLDDDDGGAVGGLLGEGAGAVREAVVGNVDPTTGGGIGGGRGVGVGEAVEEEMHGSIVQACGAGRGVADDAWGESVLMV